MKTRDRETDMEENRPIANISSAFILNLSKIRNFQNREQQIKLDYKIYAQILSKLPLCNGKRTMQICN